MKHVIKNRVRFTTYVRNDVPFPVLLVELQIFSVLWEGPRRRRVLNLKSIALLVLEIYSRDAKFSRGHVT